MKYHAPTNKLVIDPKQLERVSYYLISTIRSIRKLCDKPTTPYEVEGPLTNCELAQQLVVRVAEELDIDLGSDHFAHELDVSKGE